MSRYTNLLFSFMLHYAFYRKIKFLVEATNFDTKEKIEEYQFAKLKELIVYSYKNVPYYRKLFDQIGFKPNEFKCISDIKKIPYLTKQIIREHQSELISTHIPKKYIKKVKTGGTTGMPTEFLLDKRYSTLAEMVFLRNMWNRIGYKPRDRCVVLREDKVRQIIPGKKYWKTNSLTNWLVMSSFHLNADTFYLFYNKIQQFKPKFILAFASNAYLLAKYIKDNQLANIPSLKGVICASENLYDWQRKYMEEVFNAKIFSYYGHSEKCILASECSDSSSYEFYPQYGFVELITKNGEDCSTEDERGEIIATGFNNYVSPFIRYKTDDIGTYTSRYSPDHPHWFHMKRIEGRTQDFLLDIDNVPKTYLHIDRPFWSLRDKVYAYQYIQNDPGKVILHIHAKTSLNELEIQQVRDIFNNTYFKIDIDIKQVDYIPRAGSGKFRYLVQNIKIN
jgi:phenylacetate-CoA ligase